MRPCQAAPAFDTTTSTPPKCSAIRSNDACTEAAPVTSQRSASAAPRTVAVTARAAASLTSRSATSAPAAANALAVAAPIAPPAPVTTAIWPASGSSFAAPSFACSSDQYSQSNMSASEIDSKRPMASASVMVSTAASARSAATLASFLEQAEPGHKHHAGQGIEHRLDAAAARIMAYEVVPVVFDERGGGRLRARRELPVGVGRLQHQGPVLGANGVIRRHHAGGGVTFHI